MTQRSSRPDTTQRAAPPETVDLGASTPDTAQGASSPDGVDIKPAVKWLDNHWKQSRNCPICNATKWEIDSELVEVRLFRWQEIEPGAPVRALVVVTCANCGYTILFDAVTAGIVRNSNKE